jgi:hypothetical protein
MAVFVDLTCLLACLLLLLCVLLLDVEDVEFGK